MQNSSENLSVRFESDGFSVIIKENDRMLASEFIRCKPFELSEEELVKLLDSKTELSSVPAEIQVVIYPNTLVPAPIFEKEYAEDLLNFASQKVANSVILFNTLDEMDTVNIFRLPEKFRSAVQKKWKETTITHHISFIIRKFISSLTGDFAFLYASKERTDIFVIGNGKLVFFNSFATNTPEDLAYFVLSILNQLHLEPENSVVYFVNESDKPQLFDTTKKYISNCKSI